MLAGLPSGRMTFSEEKLPSPDTTVISKIIGTTAEASKMKQPLQNWNCVFQLVKESAIIVH